MSDNLKRRRSESLEPTEVPPKSKLKSGAGSQDRTRITDDVDFEPDDYEGRIERCEWRIQQGHMKQTFEKELKRLKAEKGVRDALAKQYPGLGWEEIQRIGDLSVIAAHLEDEKDPHGELPNVKAIIDAYEKGMLRWDNNATYWAQGQMIHGPKEFSWDDFKAWNTEKNRGGGGFWVEGIFPLFPRNKAHRMKTGSWNWQLVPQMNISVRLSNILEWKDHRGNAFPEVDIRFMDDTGASMMLIYEQDMRVMMGGDTARADAPEAHLMGYQRFRLGDNTDSVSMVIAVEATMSGNDDRGARSEMVPWRTIPCTVLSGNAGPRDDRLNGPWLRSMFYVGSVPAYPSTLYVASTKSALTQGPAGLPSVNPNQIKPPQFRAPRRGVIWTLDRARNILVPSSDSTRTGKVPAGV